MIPYLPHLLELALLYAALVWLVLCVAMTAMVLALLGFEALRPRRQPVVRIW